MEGQHSPTTYPGSPKDIGRVPFNLTLRTADTAYCPGCGNLLNRDATGVRYGIAWCWSCFTDDTDYPIRVALMIICERDAGEFSDAKGVIFYTPRLDNPGSYPSFVDRQRGGDGRTNIPDYGNTWPRWIPPHAEVIIYALQHHLLHPDALMSIGDAIYQHEHDFPLPVE